MKTSTNFNESFQPSIPKPRTFSQTKAAPPMGKGFGPASISSGTTRADPRSGSKGLGPLSVPRSGCCGKL